MYLNVHEAFKMFNGMFAFSLWDERNKSLYIVRDRFGIKPLYYYQDDELLLFASEIKALRAHRDFKSGINHQGLSEYLWYGTALGESSLYDRVKKLLPGHFIKVTKNNFQLKLMYLL